MNYSNKENKLNNYILGNVLIYTGTTNHNIFSIYENIAIHEKMINRNNKDTPDKCNINDIITTKDYLKKIKLYEKYQNIKNDIFTPTLI